MICDKENKPEFSDALLEECRKCKWASKLIKWCGCPKFGGMHLRKEKSNIILPDRKIKYPSLTRQAKNLAGSMKDFVKSGFKLRSKKERTKCLSICESNKCDMYDNNKMFPNRCKACGCCTNLAKLIESKKCPLGLW